MSKVIIITGASSGIGFALAEYFGKKGILADLFSEMKNIAPEMRKDFGLMVCKDCKLSDMYLRPFQTNLLQMMIQIQKPPQSKRHQNPMILEQQL